MKKLYASCILGISCLCLCAETTTVFNFSAGPESGITVPNGFNWPTESSLSATINNNAFFTIGDISIYFAKDSGRQPLMYKDSEADNWYCRFFNGNKLTIISENFNIIRFKGTLMNGYTPSAAVVTGGGSFTYGEEPPTFTWTGECPAVTLKSTSTMYILKLEVTTDGGASAETDLMDDGDEMRAQYYTLQGVKVENPSGGMFVRISDGKATKVVIP